MMSKLWPGSMEYSYFNVTMTMPYIQVSLLERELKQNCKVDYLVRICPGKTYGFVHYRKEDINTKNRTYIEEDRKGMVN